MSSLLEKLTLDVLIFCETIYPFKNDTQIKYYLKQKVATKHDVWYILKRALPEILVQENFWKHFILFGKKWTMISEMEETSLTSSTLPVSAQSAED